MQQPRVAVRHRQLHQIGAVVVFDDYGDRPAVHNPSPDEGSWTKDSWRRAITRASVAAFEDIDTSGGKVAVNVPPVPGSRPSIEVLPGFGYRRF